MDIIVIKKLLGNIVFIKQVVLRNEIAIIENGL